MEVSRRVGLALSGGGALGAAHIGVLEVLEENGVIPCCVSGTSAGSAVGLAYCAGLPVERLRELALEMRWSRLGRMVPPRNGFFDGQRMEDYVRRVIGDRRFEDLEKPFACVATDILRDEVVILRSGPVAPAIRASCAFPGIFTPVEKGERLLVDGGLMCNLPVAVLTEMGAEYTIAVDLLSPKPRVRRMPETVFEMWFQSLRILMFNTGHEAELADVVIAPDVGEFSGFDLRHAEALIAAGRLAAAEHIVQIRRDLGLEELGGS